MCRLRNVIISYFDQISTQAHVTAATVHTNSAFLPSRISSFTFTHCDFAAPVAARLRIVQTTSGAYTAPYTMGIGVLYPGLCGRGVMLTTHVHLVPTL